jgi:hypothetical protein
VDLGTCTRKGEKVQGLESKCNMILKISVLSLNVRGLSNSHWGA